MSITFKELQAKLGPLVRGEWHQHSKGGGWVQNTAHVDATATIEGLVSGDAWVFGDALVAGNAQVSGNAWVSGDALVSGNAQVFGNARVSGDAQVFGDAWTFSPLFISGTKHSVTTCTHTKIQIGCQCYSVAQWQAHYKSIGKAQGYTPDQVEEYGMILALCADWLKAKFGTENVSIRDAKGRFKAKS